MLAKNKPFLKIVSLTLIGAFCLQELSFAQGIEALVPRTVSASNISQKPSLFEAPLEYANLKEIHQGTNGSLIILMEDAHSNYSGQMNLANALDQIIAKYGVSLVLSEGGAEDVSLTPLKKLAPPYAWKKVAKSSLLQGKISGEEYLNLTSNHPMKIMGLEDLPLYLESLQVYAALADKRQKTLEYIQQVQNILFKIKNKLYPKELLDYEKSENFENKIKKLIELSTSDLSGYSTVKKFKEIQAREIEINFDKANLEQAALIEAIAKAGGGMDLKEHLKNMNQLQTNKLSLLALFEKTLTIAKAYHIDMHPYEHLLAYGAYLRKFIKLDFEELLNEIEPLENEVFNSRLTDDDSRLVHCIDRYLEILESAYRIQMTTQDFESFLANETDFGTMQYQAFINKKLVELGYFEDLVIYKNLLDKGKDSLKQFYNSVRQRDFTFLRNAERYLQAEKQSTAVMIAGGYHTAHLKKLLADKGYSIVILTPLVTEETNQSRYEKELLAPIQKGAKTISLGLEENPIEMPKRKADGIRVASLGLAFLERADWSAISPSEIRLRLTVIQKNLALAKRLSGGRGVNQAEIDKLEQRLQTMHNNLAKGQNLPAALQHVSVSVGGARLAESNALSQEAAASNVMELFKIFSWLPHPKNLDSILTSSGNEAISSQNYEEQIRNVTLKSSEDFALFFSALYTWAGEQGVSTIQVNNTLVRNIRRDVDRYLTGQSSLTETADSIISAIQSDSPASGIEQLLSKPLRGLLESYRIEFHSRFFRDGTKSSIERPFSWKETAKHFMAFRRKKIDADMVFYRLMKSDPIHAFFSVPLWMLLSSFIGGVTLAAVSGFISRFILTPLYDGLVHRLKNNVRQGDDSSQENIWGEDETILHAGSTWPEIRRAYYRTESRSLEGEVLSPALRLYLFENLLARIPRLESVRHLSANIRRRILEREPIGDQRELWNIAQIAANEARVSLKSPEAVFLLNVIDIPLRDPQKKFSAKWFLEIAKRVFMAFVMAPIRMLRGSLKRLNFEQLELVLWRFQNVLRILMGFAPQPHSGERKYPRTSANINPFFISKGDAQQKQSLLEYLKYLNIEDTAPLLEHIKRHVHFRFGAFLDPSWCPRIFVSFHGLPTTYENGEYSYDLGNSTMTLSSQMPDFLNVIVLMKLVSLSFRHEIIPGRVQNIHLTDPALLSIQKRLLWAIAKDMLMNGKTYFEKTGKDYIINLIHLAYIFSNVLFGRAHSFNHRPGILTSNQPSPGVRAFVRAREGFVVGAYFLFGKKYLITTDQPEYPSTKMTGGPKWLAPIFGFLAPLKNLSAALAPALAYLTLFVTIFSGFILHLDLEFLKEWADALVDFLGMIEWFGIGQAIQFVWQQIVSSYQTVREWVDEVLRLIFRINLQQIRDVLQAFWETLLPVRTFFEDVIIPVFYQVFVPAFLFFWGLLNGYLIFKADFRARLLKTVPMTAQSITSLLFLPLYSILKFCEFVMDEAEVEAMSKKLSVIHNRISKIFSALLRLIVDVFYLGWHGVGFMFYAVTLGLISFPPLNLRSLVLGWQSLGIPLTPAMFIGFFILLLAFPYSNFWLIHEKVSQRILSARARKVFFIGMLAVTVFFTVLTPPALNFAYRENWTGSERITKSKEEFINDYRDYTIGLKRERSMISSSFGYSATLSDPLSEEKRKAVRGDEWSERPSLIVRPLIRINQALYRPRKGMENVVNPQTGMAAFVDESGQALSDTEYLLWVQQNRQKIIQGLREKNPALYGNSAFFEHLMTEIGEYHYLAIPGEFSFNFYSEMFSPEEWRLILNHMHEIASGKVLAKSYTENYYYRSKAIQVLRHFFVYPESFERQNQRSPLWDLSEADPRFFPVGIDVLRKIFSLEVDDRDLAAYLRNSKKMISDSLSRIQHFDSEQPLLGRYVPGDLEITRLRGHELALRLDAYLLYGERSWYNEKKGDGSFGQKAFYIQIPALNDSLPSLEMKLNGFKTDGQKAVDELAEYFSYDRVERQSELRMVWEKMVAEPDRTSLFKDTLRITVGTYGNMEQALSDPKSIERVRFMRELFINAGAKELIDPRVEAKLSSPNGARLAESEKPSSQRFQTIFKARPFSSPLSTQELKDLPGELLVPAVQILLKRRIGNPTALDLETKIETRFGLITGRLLRDNQTKEWASGILDFHDPANPDQILASIPVDTELIHESQTNLEQAREETHLIQTVESSPVLPTFNEIMQVYRLKEAYDKRTGVKTDTARDIIVAIPVTERNPQELGFAMSLFTTLSPQTTNRLHLVFTTEQIFKTDGSLDIASNPEDQTYKSSSIQGIQNAPILVMAYPSKDTLAKIDQRAGITPLPLAAIENADSLQVANYAVAFMLIDLMGALTLEELSALVTNDKFSQIFKSALQNKISVSDPKWKLKATNLIKTASQDEINFYIQELIFEHLKPLRISHLLELVHMLTQATESSS